MEIVIGILAIIILLIIIVCIGSASVGRGYGLDIVLSLALAAVLLVSIVLHELGHSLTARAFGYRTRLITLSLLGGCASLCAMPRKAWQEFLTAAAGPRSLCWTAS